MEIISLEKSDSGNFCGWVRTKDFYKKFHTDEDNVEIDVFVPKCKYESYRHFAMIIGKFDPYCFFLKRPLRVDRLTVRVLKLIDKGFY